MQIFKPVYANFKFVLTCWVLPQAENVFLKDLRIKSVTTPKMLHSATILKKLLYNFRTSLIFKEQPLMVASQKKA